MIEKLQDEIEKKMGLIVTLQTLIKGTPNENGKKPHNGWAGDDKKKEKDGAKKHSSNWSTYSSIRTFA